LTLSGCREGSETIITSTTMGTVFTVRVVDADRRARTGLEQDISQRLAEINAALSMYREDSEISALNAWHNTEQPMPIGPDLRKVLATALHVHEMTEGAFDPTVKPLVDAWGFGTPSGPIGTPSGSGQTWKPPAISVIHYALQDVGLEGLTFCAEDQVRKSRPFLQLDLGAIAKGYAVDELAAILRRRGIEDFLVDIGGDIMASGSNKQGQPWRIGLNRPMQDAEYTDLMGVLRLTNTAVITSGDYRRYARHLGRTYSHIIDPRSGYPVQNNVASVTVLARNAAFADALATGLMVMGREKGLELVEALSGVEAAFIERSGADQLTLLASSGYPQ